MLSNSNERWVRCFDFEVTGPELLLLVQVQASCKGQAAKGMGYGRKLAGSEDCSHNRVEAANQLAFCDAMQCRMLQLVDKCQSNNAGEKQKKK